MRKEEIELKLKPISISLEEIHFVYHIVLCFLTIFLKNKNLLFLYYFILQGFCYYV